MNEKSSRLEFRFLYFALPFFLFFFLLFFTKRVVYSIIFSIAAMINMGIYIIQQKALLSVIQEKHTKGFYLFSYFLRLVFVLIAFLLLVGADFFAALAFLAGMSLIPLSLTVYALRQRNG